MPPVAPMLAKPAPDIPEGQLYEPKWDGFRSIIFRDGDEVEIGSRNERPMTRYFPEVVEAVRANFPQRASSTARSSSPTERGTLDFEALQQRIHPAASRVTLLARADARPASSPSTCWPSATTTSPGGRSPSAAPLLEQALADAAAAGPPHAGDPGPSTSRGSGSSSSRAPGWTASSPSRST